MIPSRPGADADRHGDDVSEMAVRMVDDDRAGAVHSAMDDRFGRLSRQLVTPRSWLLAIGHALVFAGVYWLAYLLRFDFEVPADNVAIFWSTLAWVIGLKLLVFYLLAQFQGWWRM